ncbi:hypothetical protein ABZ281_02385, partial [Streptomyces sp. NPDC006265]|uniref:hypothetical protein n=1 Tax=Streptomyces sp. NPDC006265 TaxID=3156740 RepID=UPI00339E4219
MISSEGKGNAARVLRRSALWGALPLALVVLAGWIWYQVSDTGRRWRYEDHLGSYCDGVLPSSQAAELTGLRPDRLYNDLRSGGRKTYNWYCVLDDVQLTLSRLPDADDDVIGPRNVQFYFPQEDASALLASSPLGGGWTAADVREGTCAGLSVESHPGIAWAWGAHTDPRPLDERCVLSTSNELPADQTDAERHTWTLEARYGAQALAAAIERRNWSDETNEYRDRFRATAQCPGSTVLARFSVRPSQRRAKDNTAAVALLKAFVLRAAERHGCTDVQLPPPGTANDPPPWEKDTP